MPPRLLRLFPFLLLLLLGQARAGQTFGISLTNPGAIKIEAESLLNEIPTYGHYPVRVTITNRSGAERSWDLSLSLNGNSEQRAHRSTLTVPDGRTQSFDFLLPVSLDNSSGWNSQSIQGRISGPGLADGSVQFYEHSNWNDPANSSCVGVMAGLFDRVGLNEAKSGHSSSGRQQSRNRLDPAKLPANPLAFSGLQDIWMDATEWLALPPALRLALLDWTALGGNLQIVNNLPAGSDQAWAETLPRSVRAATGASANTLEHGLGRIVRRNSRPDREMRDTVEKHFSPHGGLVPTRPLGQGEAFAWAEQRGVSAITMGGLIIVVFLIIFTIVAGPVNLFVFARGANRWRLFLTTPVISLVASGLLVLLMFLQDGLGGAGARTRVALLLPESGTLALRQVSAVKTGLLTSSAFSAPAKPSVWRDSFDSGNSRRSYATDDAGNHSGDLFASRSRLFHQTFALLPSEGRLTRQPDENGRPVLLSTVDAVLGPLYLTDEKGKLWKTDQLALGGKAVLEPVPTPSTDLSNFLNEAQKHNLDGRLLDRLAGRSNLIVAKAANLKTDAGDLHGAIRWTSTETILVTTPAAP